LRCHVFSIQSGVEVCLCFSRRDVPDRLEQAAVVEPIDPFECGILDGLETAPRAATMDDLRLEEAIDGLGESVVVAVADAADGRFDAGLAEPLRA
tara:strand:+ start:319 stop:603 length:285 start_codon:yes stop_codon:yes gene_type:complete